MKPSLKILGTACMICGFCVPAFAGYVLSTDGNWQYAGTGSHWVNDATVTGKAIKDCTVTLTDRGLSLNGAADGNLLLDGATVTYQPDKANGNSQHLTLGASSNAELTLDNGSRFYWITDDTWDSNLGGGYSYANIGSNGFIATININNGSLLDVKRHYFGNHNTAGSTTSVTMNVDGGTLNYSGTLQGLYLGWHNPITLTISDGGVVSSNTTLSLSASGGTSPGNASTVKIVGNSTMQAATVLSFGSKSYGPTTISFLADNSGLGKMVAGTSLSKGTYGTVAYGIDHALAVMDTKAYEVVSSTSNNLADITTGLWTTKKTGGSVTATLNSTMKLGGADYELEIGKNIDVTEAFAVTGWTEIADSENYALTLELEGLDALNATQAFVDWYNTSDNDSKATMLADNLILLSSFTPGQGVFAWDFSGYTAATVTLGNIGAQVAPEPAAWLLLLCGLLGQRIVRKREKRNH